MPELPDVELFRRYFDRSSLNQEVRGIEVYDRRILDQAGEGDLLEALNGRRFEFTRRHGKFMFAATDGDAWLVLHFGMTGYLSYLDGDGDPPGHTRVLFRFANGGALAFVDQRILGLAGVIDDPDQFIADREMGEDAYDIESDRFLELLHGRRGMIKSALTNQAVLAGIGNVYADEILFQSRIHPKAQVRDLSDDELQTLYEQTRRVLEVAIDSEVDIERMPDWFLLRHRQEGEPCPRCGTAIETVKVSSRTTYFCPSCQPER